MRLFVCHNLKPLNVIASDMQLLIRIFSALTSLESTGVPKYDYYELVQATVGGERDSPLGIPLGI